MDLRLPVATALALALYGGAYAQTTSSPGPQNTAANADSGQSARTNPADVPSGAAAATPAQAAAGATPASPAGTAGEGASTTVNPATPSTGATPAAPAMPEENAASPSAGAAATAATTQQFGQGWNQQRCADAKRTGQAIPAGSCPGS